MTELQLYKFIEEYDVEWHIRDNDGVQDVLILPRISVLEDFCNLIKGYKSDDGGLVVRLMDGYAAIWMNEICEHYGIEANNVFVGEC